MKTITIALLLLATMQVQSTKKKFSADSFQQYLCDLVADKELALKRAEEQLNERKQHGAQPSEMRKLKKHIATKRSSLQLYKDGLAALGKQEIQHAAQKEEHQVFRQRCNKFCQQWYPHLVMGSLYGTLVCAVSVDVIRLLCEKDSL